MGLSFFMAGSTTAGSMRKFGRLAKRIATRALIHELTASTVL